MKDRRVLDLLERPALRRVDLEHAPQKFLLLPGELRRRRQVKVPALDLADQQLRVMVREGERASEEAEEDHASDQMSAL